MLLNISMLFYVGSLQKDYYLMALTGYKEANSHHCNSMYSLLFLALTLDKMNVQNKINITCDSSNQIVA